MKTVGNYMTMLGAAAVDAAPKPVGLALSGSTMEKLKTEVLPALVGGGVGYYVGGRYKHRWLGMLGGATVAGEAHELMSGDRGTAFARMIPTAAGIAGSLYWKKRPVLGFLGGFAAGLVVPALVK